MQHRYDIFSSLKVEKMKSESFKILYAHVFFHFIPIWTNLNETHLPYLLLWHRNDIFQWWNVEKMKFEALKILYARTLVHFIPIWTNLNFLI